MKDAWSVVGIFVGALAVCAGIEIALGGRVAWIRLFDDQVFVSFLFVPIAYSWLRRRAQKAGEDPASPPRLARICAMTWLAGGIGAALGGLVTFAGVTLSGRASPSLGDELPAKVIAGFIYGLAFASIAVIVGRVQHDRG